MGGLRDVGMINYRGLMHRMALLHLVQTNDQVLTYA